MSDSYMGMGENIYNLLYTNKEGEKEDSYEMGLLEDKDTPWERVETLISLLQPVSDIKDILIPLESAKLLTSWGIEDGLKYLEYLVDNRVDRLGCISPHRLHSYDQVYEEIQDAITNYYVRYADRLQEEGNKSAQRIEPVLKKIIKLSIDLPFELTCLPYIKRGYNRDSYESVLKRSFVELVKKGEYKWKIEDLKKLLFEWDSDFVSETLQRYSANLA